MGVGATGVVMIVVIVLIVMFVAIFAAVMVLGVLGDRAQGRRQALDTMRTAQQMSLLAWQTGQAMTEEAQRVTGDDLDTE